MFRRRGERALDDLGIPRRARIIAEGTALIPGSEAPAPVIATSLGLYVAGWDGVVRWDEIETARWDEPMIDMTIRAGDQVRHTRLRLDQFGGLAEAIHDRVTASVVTSESVDLGDGVRANFVARRRSDDGTISWTVLFDPGVDAENPRIRAAAQAHLDDLRQSLGV